jgi:hypothetical protein
MLGVQREERGCDEDRLHSWRHPSEQRDLIRFYGDNYRKYREQVWLIFRLRLRKR